MTPAPLIGSRTIVDQLGRTVYELSVFMPYVRDVENPDSDWVCELSLTGPNQNFNRRKVHGVDALQALQLALKFLGSTLRHENEKGDGQLRLYQDDRPGEFDLPEFGDSLSAAIEWKVKT
ncbi:hypothetical protein L5876_04955 [Hyphobacterium sp. SN044]|uniref:DUF6968 family protein n=1 Tax=Hyphobacterium sp. SN044 TaxID=2912575 RepID=UPI001F2B0116|nr:hypothetical protein [Hyphobacterium sp. SN044]MCF8879160.1 hypothetical protein [Hyphobacterium sp. SN044]